MPQELEAKLRAEAEAKFPGDKERQDAFVYGTMRKTGWRPERERRRRGYRRDSEAAGDA